MFFGLAMKTIASVRSLHHVLQSFGILLQVRSFNQYRHPHRGESRLLAAPQHDESFLSQSAAQISRHDRDVDQAAFKGLAEDRHVADDDHLNIVPALIKPEMFQPYCSGFPYAAAETLNAEALAAQIFGRLDAGASDEIEILAAAEAGDNFHISSAHSGGDSGRGATVGDLRVAGYERGDLGWIAAHPYAFRIDPVFSEEIAALGDPERDRRRAHARVGDDDLTARSACRIDPR